MDVQRASLIGAYRTELDDVIKFKHGVFEDHRGTYEEIYNKKVYSEHIRRMTGQDIEFVEDNIALSFRHVLRGIHGDDRTWKLVTCLRGKFYIVVVCCNKESKDFGKWQSFVLSDSNKTQILVPPNHGHGYVVMSDNAIFHYKQSCNYKGAKEQFTYKYNDSKFGIWWPVQSPILSVRDARGEV